jgi:hypothetical protein
MFGRLGGENPLYMIVQLGSIDISVAVGDIFGVCRPFGISQFRGKGAKLDRGSRNVPAGEKFSILLAIIIGAHNKNPCLLDDRYRNRS